MANKIAVAREQQVFVKKETTRGTLITPEATDLVVACGYITSNQQPSFTDSCEIVDSRDILEQFQDQTPPGDWNFDIIARPSGTAGTEPNGDPLYESLMGTKTVVGTTSVTYSPALEKPSFSIWFKKSHTVFFCAGGTVAKATVKLEAKGAVTWNMSGQFMSFGFAGTDYLASDAVAADTDITVVDAKKYTVDAIINVGTDDNGGDGYTITAINTTTNVIDINPAIVTGATSGDEVVGWLPTGTQTSTPIENRKSLCKVAGTTVPVKTATVNFDDAPFYIDDEITSVDHPTDYVETQRNISGSLDIYFRQDDLDYFTDGLETNNQTFELLCGEDTGYIMSVYSGKCRLSVPSVKETDPTVSLNMPIKMLGTNGEDSCSIIFK